MNTPKSFWSRNAVMLVMVPVLVGAHYGWLSLQGMDELVTAEDRQKLPSVTKALREVFNKNVVKPGAGAVGAVEK